MIEAAEHVTYRLYYEKPYDRFYRLRITADTYSGGVETIEEVRFGERKPKYREMDELIEKHDMISYGDMKRLHDGSFVLMLRKRQASK